MEAITRLYADTFGTKPADIKKLPGQGSNRIYYRLTAEDGTTMIACQGTNAEENRAFCHLAEAFRKQGLPVPEVYAISDDAMTYLQQDMGSTSLFDVLKEGRTNGGQYSKNEYEVLRKVIQLLPRFQHMAAADTSVFGYCYPTPAMNHENIMFDLNYFKYCYLKLTGLEFNEIPLEHDFRKMADALLADENNTFLYRDFQARNVMMKDGTEPYFIDFQGGRRGPIYYDVASFLWQASAKYSDDLRNQLVDDYLEALETYRTITSQLFRQRLMLFVLFRTLQVLGAYGFRGLWEKKEHFINSIPPALANLHKLIKDGVCDEYPYLKEVLTGLCCQVKQEQEQSNIKKLIDNDKTYLSKEKKDLVVSIYSFSYKKGIPTDESGNGGGYVFDCRATHNPGRYEQYKPLTGLDAPVIEFLEEDGEILQFLESVYKLADFHVARFMERGFTHLMFSCGCTGGRHRSVYSAQHLAEHIHNRFGVEVRICHREQGISSILPKRP